MTFQIEHLLTIMVAASALALVWVRDLFAVVVVLSVYSGLLAVLFALMGAVDVAFMEAVVGTTMSTVCFIGLMWWVDPDELALLSVPRRLVAVAPAAGLGFTGFLLLLTQQQPGQSAYLGRLWTPRSGSQQRLALIDCLQEQSVAVRDLKCELDSQVLLDLLRREHRSSEQLVEHEHDPVAQRAAVGDHLQKTVQCTQRRDLGRNRQHNLLG